MIPNWLEPFSPEFQQAVMTQLKDPGPNPLATFDADGTLWSGDIGEAFFKWLIAGNLLPNHDCTKDIYSEYEARVDEDRAKGYVWAVQAMAGLPVQDVVAWSRQMAHAWPNYRPQMAGLVKGLAESGFDVWIVSATNRWTVTEGGRFMGFSPDRVIGMSVETADDKITDTPTLPLVANTGKVQVIDSVIGRRPNLAFGDSFGDLEMLEYALKGCVLGRPGEQGAFLEKAREKGWPIHLFNF